jgi:hypothetical protein
MLQFMRFWTFVGTSRYVQSIQTKKTKETSQNVSVTSSSHFFEFDAAFITGTSLPYVCFTYIRAKDTLSSFKFGISVPFNENIFLKS